jgi:hypothetical protein
MLINYEVGQKCIRTLMNKCMATFLLKLSYIHRLYVLVLVRTVYIHRI